MKCQVSNNNLVIAVWVHMYWNQFINERPFVLKKVNLTIKIDKRLFWFGYGLDWSQIWSTVRLLFILLIRIIPISKILYLSAKGITDEITNNDPIDICSVFCQPHRPNFSDIFDLCLHWVSVVRVWTYRNKNQGRQLET